MTPKRPYLLRAIHEWLVDNHLTPHLLVDAGRDGVQVPEAYVRDGQIVLNIAPGAVRDLELANDLVSFSARFGGVPMQVRVPPEAVLGIYARENGHGMMFLDEPEAETPPDGDDSGPSGSSGGSRRPSLKVVK